VRGLSVTFMWHDRPLVSLVAALATYPLLESISKPLNPTSKHTTQPQPTVHQAELVGPRQPISRLVDRYQASSADLGARLSTLAPEFPSCRAVMGDGNCFYRGFLFGLLEALLEQPHVQLHARCGAL